MILRRTCAWCGATATALWPLRLRDFSAQHDQACGASASLHWLDDAREVLVEDLGLHRLATDVAILDLRASAAHVA